MRAMILGALLVAGPVALGQIPGGSTGDAWGTLLPSSGGQSVTIQTAPVKGQTPKWFASVQPQAGTEALPGQSWSVLRPGPTPAQGLTRESPMLALNESSAVRTPLAQFGAAHAMPIPTQWPQAKMEAIPTQWPKLTLEPIGGAGDHLQPGGTAPAGTKK